VADLEAVFSAGNSTFRLLSVDLNSRLAIIIVWRVLRSVASSSSSENMSKYSNPPYEDSPGLSIAALISAHDGRIRGSEFNIDLMLLTMRDPSSP
jgi:hypothetical protein